MAQVKKECIKCIFLCESKVGGLHWCGNGCFVGATVMDLHHFDNCDKFIEKNLI